MALGTTADLNIRVDATTASAEAGLERLRRSTLAYEGSLRRAQLAAAQLDHQLEQESAAKYAAQTHALEQAGRGLLLFGGVTAAGLALSAKAAIDWESAWTGVRKTVDGSDAELAAVEKGLRDLAKTLPTSHEEIAAVAEAAGQLGIRAKDIVGFTKTMIDLGQTTNLTATDAATSMARFANIMQTPQAEVDRLGASLVALGNDGASTEAEILTMGNRIAAAGQLVGLTEGEVLGLANAMSSLGLEAEAGGTAISMTLREMSTAVAEGGDSLEGFARVAGMSADEFGRLFTTDAAAATEAFASGLGRIKQQGGDVNATLAGLDITGVRQVDTLLRLAQSGNLLADSLNLGNRAYQENSALTEEANKRYDTTAAKLEIAKNQVVDLGISLGETLLPVLGQTAGALSEIGGFLNGLPGPVKTLITTFGVAAATIGIFGGAALTSVAKVRTMKTELATARESFGEVNKGALAARTGALALAAGLPMLTSAIGGTSEGMNDLNMVLSGAAAGFALTGGPWGAAIGAGVGLLGTLASGSDSAADAQARLQQHIQEVSGTLNQQTGALTRNTEQWVNSKLAQDDFVGTSESAFDSAESLGISLNLVQQAARGDEDAFDRLNAQLDKTIEGAGGIGVGMDEAGFKALNLRAAVNESRDSIDGAQQAARQSRDANEDLGRSYQGTGNKAQDAAKAIRELVAAERAAAEAAIQNKRDQLALISTMQSAREEARRGKRTLDENTKAGQENWAALLDLADQWETSSNKVRNADGAYKDIRRTFIDVAREMGAGEEKAKNLADRFLSIPPAARKASQGAQGMAADIGRSLRSINDEPVNINLTPGAAKIASVDWQLERRAMGGRLTGGIPGVDSLPILAMPEEHIFTTDDVRKAGRGNFQAGHNVMYAIRRMIQRGELGKLGDIPAFRNGGAVLDPRTRMSGLPAAVNSVEAQLSAVSAELSRLLSAAVSKALEELPVAGMLGTEGTLTPAQLVRGMDFAKSQAGKPYIWGGVGPSGYDCSGFQSAVLNSSLGRFPYSRVGSTGTMPWPGSAPGTGRYTIGWFTGSPGHTSGNIGGLGVESSGGVGVRVGSGARSPLDSMFNSVMHYDRGGVWPHGTLGVNMSGGDELVINPRRMAEGGRVAGGNKPLSNKEIRDILGGVIDRFGKRSPIVDAIERWLDGLKRAEFSQKALNHRIGEVIRAQSTPALRQFNIGPGQDVGTTRGELRELLATLRETFGKDAPLVRRVEHLGERLLNVQKRQDKTVAAYERANDKLATINDNMRQFSSEVRAAFTHDPFASDISSARGSRTQIRADANMAEAAIRQFRRLGRLGLDDSVVRDLAKSGNTALIRDLAGSSRKEIAAFERDFRRRNRALRELGLLTGRQVFGDERKQQIKVVHRLGQEVNHLNRVLNRFERRMERRIAEGAKKGVQRGMSDRQSQQRRRRAAKAIR